MCQLCIPTRGAIDHGQAPPCERVELDFIESAPYRFVSTVDLPITPQQLFEVLEDAESWPHWATVITRVTWTSEPRAGWAPPGR